MSMIVPKHKFMKYISKIFESIKLEIELAKPKIYKDKITTGNPAIEVLTCIKLIFKNYGEEFRSYFDS